MIDQYLIHKTQAITHVNEKLVNGTKPQIRTFQNKKIYHIIEKNHDIILHSMMCSIGGLMGGYALLCRGNLGSAQTINLIEIMLGIVGRNRNELLLRLIGLFLYFAGLEICFILSKKTHINLQRYSIAVDMAGFLILTAIPDNASKIIGLMPVFFMLSTQWSVFSGARGYTSASVFSTNNFRQTVLALSEYAFGRDRAQLKKAIFFMNSLFWFHVNVILSYFLVNYFSVNASLFGFVYAIPAFMITYVGKE